MHNGADLSKNVKSSIPPTQDFRQFLKTSDRRPAALCTLFSQRGENDIQMNHPLTTEGADNTQLFTSRPEPELYELGSAFKCFRGIF